MTLLAARARGSARYLHEDILTTNGYVQRFVNDWAAPRGQIRGVELRLGVPNYAGDTLRLTGLVSGKHAQGHGGIVELAVTGTNSLGSHVTALVRVEVARMSALRDRTAVVGIRCHGVFQGLRAQRRT